MTVAIGQNILFVSTHSLHISRVADRFMAMNRVLPSVLSPICSCAVFTILVLFPFVLQAQEREECLACHGDPSLTMARGGREVSLHVQEQKLKTSAHGDLNCTECHEGLLPGQIPHAPKIVAVSCSHCHGEVHSAIHSASKGLRAKASCVECHSGHEVERLTDEDSVARGRVVANLCSRCHEGVTKAYRESSHGVALAQGVRGAPACNDCHREHGIDSLMTTGPLKSKHAQAELCLHCHLDNPDIRARMGPSAGFIASYDSSAHGRAIREGNESAASCVDCHGSHEMKKGSDPSSRVSKQMIAQTCGTCHAGENELFQESVHGKAITKGVMASATCTDCHGEHGILSPGDERSPVSSQNLSAKVCSPCHASVRLTEKYGIASDRFESFRDSYHGLAGRGGSVEVANCSSCHGFHDIKPSTDSTSRIHKSNIVATCGACHPGANENFAKGAVHLVDGSGPSNLVELVSNAYIILIVVIVGGMLVHNLLDFLRAARLRLRDRRSGVQHVRAPHRLYLRMSLSERLQHGTLLVSFFTLVVTGFMLKFPDAWWVLPIREISPTVFEVRSVLHRIAGACLIISGLYHLYYLFRVPRGKQLIRDLLPVRSDISDLVDMMKYNVGLSSHRPRFGRFSYIEKSEYWALLWGTVVMAVTGVILWFENTFIGLLTKLWWDVSEAVHYYEAWLATLAVVVWHLYYVIFNPRVYPMSAVWLKGTLTEEEMVEEHPLELEQIKRQEHGVKPEGSIGVNSNKENTDVASEPDKTSSLERPLNPKS